MISASWVSISIYLSLFGSFLPLFAPNMMFSLYSEEEKSSNLCFLVKNGMTPESFTAWTHGLVNPWLILSSHGIKKIRPRDSSCDIASFDFFAWLKYGLHSILVLWAQAPPLHHSSHQQLAHQFASFGPTT